MNEITGKAVGAIARAKALSPEKRKEIARKAIKSRWETDCIPKADRYVGILEIGDLKIPCAVLPDGRRVLSQRGVMGALGRKYGGQDFKSNADENADDGGGKLPFYLAAGALKSFISNELAAVVSEPILYRNNKGGGIAQGVPASILPQICDVWLKAREAKKLSKPQMAVAQRAEILMRGLAHVGIISLVDEATGYQRDREKDALAKILEAFVAKEIQPYLKTFPPDYYENLFRLYDLPYPPPINKSWRPQFFGKITNEVVYARLAPNLLPELKKIASKAARKAHLHRWLTQDFGHPKLREHLASIVTLQKLSKNAKEWRELVDRIHPRYGQTLPLPLDYDRSTSDKDQESIGAST